MEKENITVKNNECKEDDLLTNNTDEEKENTRQSDHP